MKRAKWIIGLSLLVLVLILPNMTPAMGPLMVTPHGLTWDREADGTGYIISGYYIYYRIAGVSTWSNTQRSALISQPAIGVTPAFDTLTLSLPNGNYEFVATAIDTKGNESGPSNMVPLTLAIPVSPTNFKTQ